MSEEIKSNTEIKDFLEDNKELLVAVGILGALVTLLANLSIGWISYLLSFLMTMSMILVWSEIKFKTSDKDGFKLATLKWCFKISFGLLVFYILLKFRILSWLFLVFPIAFLFLYWSALLFRKFDWFLNSWRSEKIINKAPAFFTFVALVVISMYLAQFISMPINNWLDQVDHWNSRINLY